MAEETEKPKKGDIIGQIIVGVLIIVVSIFLYFQFTQMEQDGGEMRINWLIALIYNALGKKAACSLLGLLGAAMSVFGIIRLKNLNKQLES